MHVACTFPPFVLARLAGEDGTSSLPSSSCAAPSPAAPLAVSSPAGSSALAAAAFFSALRPAGVSRPASARSFCARALSVSALSCAKFGREFSKL